MPTEVLQVSVVLYELRHLARQKGVSLKHIFIYKQRTRKATFSHRLKIKTLDIHESENIQGFWASGSWIGLGFWDYLITNSKAIFVWKGMKWFWDQMILSVICSISFLQISYSVNGAGNYVPYLEPEMIWYLTDGNSRKWNLSFLKLVRAYCIFPSCESVEILWVSNSNSNCKLTA
jgi:hypothetical protein